MKLRTLVWASALAAVGSHSLWACSNIADDCRSTLTCPVESKGGSGGEAGHNGGGMDGGAGVGGGLGGATATGGSSASKGGGTSSGGVTGSVGPGGAAGEPGGAGEASFGGIAATGGTPSSGGTPDRGGSTGDGGTVSNGGAPSGGKGGTTGSGGTTSQCGNGKLESEGCDDGNTTAGDGCSKTCTVESGWACPGGTATSRSVCNRSCAGTPVITCAGEDCCESPLVTGGTFQQGEPDAFASTVSDFRLDRYEVTVARFRKFVNNYDAWRSANKPAAGDGANVNVSGSGWKSEWGSNLPASAAGLVSNVNCYSGYSTLVDGADDTLPINCVNWYEAFALCIWDGGRLPTESEWEYAAAGGDSDYLYPWGGTSTTGSWEVYAVYDCLGDGSSECAFSDILPVGTRPAGQGRYLQRDLAGSMYEWVLDLHAPYPVAASTNYAKIDSGDGRVLRSSGFGNPGFTLRSAHRTTIADRGTSSGIRCARAK